MFRLQALLATLKPYSLCAILPLIAAHSTSAADTRAPTMEHTPTVISPVLDETLHAEGDTLFRGLWRLFLGENAPPLTVVPHMRATHMFSVTPNSCRYPATRLIGQYNKSRISFDGVPLIWSESFFSMTVRVFARPGLPAPSSLQSLYGKSVVVPLGYMFPPDFEPKKTSVVHVSSEHQRISLLMNKRVDYLVSSMPTAGIALMRMGYEKANFNETLLLSNLPLHLACHDTPENRTFMTRFDAAIQKARADGDIENTYVFYKNKAAQNPLPDNEKKHFIAP